ncbi:MAG TPA: hypothetical protein VE242_09860, partial [Chthoniobacterales bacterium]|nr:hypothetical protein [Chthoniobacterales bacterium]
NVTRVLARLTDLQTSVDSVDGKRILWQASESLIKDGQARLLNSAIMELGALLCLPRRPHCIICPVRRFCRAVDPDSLPRKSPRTVTRKVEENYWWIRRNESILLRQASSRRWNGLWTLPPATTIGKDQLPMFQLRHSITRYLVCLSVFAGSAPDPLPERFCWQTIASICDLPMPSPHRRSVEAILEMERK